jgi:PAS domain S-box-containing protein
MSFFISRPIEKLRKNIDKISKGDLDVVLDSSEIFEINNLTQALNRVMTSLKLAIHKVGIKRGEIFEETMKAKEKAEEKYEDLVKTIDEWVWETDANGVCTSCSAKIADALGYKPEEVIGKPIFQLMRSEEAQKVQSVFHEFSKKHQPIQKLETCYLHKNGNDVCVLASVVPVFDAEGSFCGYRGVQQDVTHVKHYAETIEELTKQLSEMKEKTRQILTDARNLTGTITGSVETAEEKRSQEEFDSMVIFDEHAHIVDCNTNMHEHLGYTKDELLSLTIPDFDVLESDTSMKKKIEEVKKQGSMAVKTIHKRKDGSSIFVSGRIHYLKDENRFKYEVKEEVL